MFETCLLGTTGSLKPSSIQHESCSHFGCVSEWYGFQVDLLDVHFSASGNPEICRKINVFELLKHQFTVCSGLNY